MRTIWSLMIMVDVTLLSADENNNRQSMDLFFDGTFLGLACFRPLRMDPPESARLFPASLCRPAGWLAGLLDLLAGGPRLQ